jgi:hypothetical protein
MLLASGQPPSRLPLRRQTMDTATLAWLVSRGVDDRVGGLQRGTAQHEDQSSRSPEGWIKKQGMPNGGRTYLPPCGL